jgi:hypothetical protein
MPTQKNVIFVLMFFTMLLVGCGAEQEAASVSFKSDVKPLIDKYCTECHVPGGDGAIASGFVTETYASVMKGTKYGPVVVAGHPLSSSLYRLVAGKVDPSIQMPHGKEALSPEEITAIEQWIEQGAKDN